MDDSELRAFHRAVQPVLQRTAPVASRARPGLAPADLDRLAWNVVLAYVANVAERPPRAIPQQARSGEGPLGDDQVRAALDDLRRREAEPRLSGKPGAVDRFRVAVRRLLGSYGWSPARAEQAAEEMARVLQATHGQ
jgi:hypothetical protein